MFKITVEQPENNLRFRDVKDNQFFVDKDGELCQKINSNSCVTIADENGVPDCYHWDEVDGDMIVRKIFAKVLKIEF
jgi:hypothetical protein